MAESADANLAKLEASEALILVLLQNVTDIVRRVQTAQTKEENRRVQEDVETFLEAYESLYPKAYDLATSFNGGESWQQIKAKGIIAWKTFVLQKNAVAKGSELITANEELSLDRAAKRNITETMKSTEDNQDDDDSPKHRRFTKSQKGKGRASDEHLRSTDNTINVSPSPFDESENAKNTNTYHPGGDLTRGGSFGGGKAVEEAHASRNDHVPREATPVADHPHSPSTNFGQGLSSTAFKRPPAYAQSGTTTFEELEALVNVRKDKSTKNSNPAASPGTRLASTLGKPRNTRMQRNRRRTRAASRNKDYDDMDSEESIA
ncbi:MAG: hypothetical protein M1833_001363 [Piccolia ochrophora]|nr:MAG: hypothetical protein M1833_001363 [Piccolia ochrophora]